MGTYGRTCVATVKASMEIGAGREIATMLNGEVGETPTGIHGTVGPQGSGGTCANAPSALSAIGVERCVGREGQGGEYFAQKDIAAYIRNYQMIVKPDETEAGTHGPITLTKRGGVNAYACGCAIKGLNASGDFLQTLPDDDVIVGAEGIGGYTRTHAGRGWRKCESAAYYAFSSGKEKSRVGPEVGIVFKIVHGSMHATLNPTVIETLRPILNRAHRSDGDTASALP